MPLDSAQWQIDILAADKTASAFASVNRNLQASRNNLQLLTGVLNGQVSAGSALVTGLSRLAAAYLTVQAAKALFDIGLKAGELPAQAEQLQVTTDLLQALRLQASTSGVGVEQLDQALIKLASSAGTANAGSADMIAKFDRLGVKLLDARGQLRPVQDLLPEVARGLLNVASSTERSALMAELFGRAGARMQTMLLAIAGGNDAVIASARQKGAIGDPETLHTWDEVNNQLAVSRQRFETLVATVGAPIAGAGLKFLNGQAAALAYNFSKAADAYRFLANLFTSTVQDQLQGAEADLQAFLDRGFSRTDAVVVELQAKVDALRAKAAAGALGGAAGLQILPPITVTATQGASQPAAKGSGRDRIGEEIERLKGEIDATARSYKQMQDLARTSLPLDELTRQVELTKKIGDELAKIGKYDKNDPRLPQVRSLIEALATADTKSKSFADALRTADQVERQFGDGSLQLAQQQRDLAAAIDTGRLSPQAAAIALQEYARAAEDTRLKNIGLAGGLPALSAGFEAAARQYAQQNTLFAQGGQLFQGTMNLMDQALSDFVQNGQVNFGKLLQSFETMLLQMAVKAAASSLFNSITGSGQGLGGLSFLGGGGSGGTGAGLFDGIFKMIAGSPFGFAGGGDTPAGTPFLVGENGPEVLISGSRGHVYNRQQLAGMGGGYGSVVVNNYAGAPVTTRRSRDASGLTRLEIVVGAETAMARRMDLGQGELVKALERKFGQGAPR